MVYRKRKLGVQCPICLDIFDIRWYAHIKDITIDRESICEECRDQLRQQLNIEITREDNYEWSDLVYEKVFS